MRLLLSIGLLAPIALAQVPAFISPAAAAIGLGPDNDNIPFSWQPTAYQQVHSASSFSAPGPGIIGLMRFRMGKGLTNWMGYPIDVELFMADSPVDACNASSVFANNVVPGTETNVFARKTLNLPTVPNNAWAISFVFDTQFSWTGGHLSWRADVWGNGNGNAFFTYPLDAFRDHGTVARTGATLGCKSARGSRPATHSATIFGPGSSSRFVGNSYDAAGGVPSSLNLGLSATSAGALTLPFDLKPLGAPGCFIVNNIVVIVANITSPGFNGQVSDTVLMPNNPRLAGARMYSQYMFLSPGANAFGIFTSDGLTDILGTPPGITRIYASGSPGSTSGTVVPSFGLSTGLN